MPSPQNCAQVGNPSPAFQDPSDSLEESYRGSAAVIAGVSGIQTQIVHSSRGQHSKPNTHNVPSRSKHRIPISIKSQRNTNIIVQQPEESSAEVRNYLI